MTYFYKVFEDDNSFLKDTTKTKEEKLKEFLNTFNTIKIISIVSDSQGNVDRTILWYEVKK